MLGILKCYSVICGHVQSSRKWRFSCAEQCSAPLNRRTQWPAHVASLKACGGGVDAEETAMSRGNALQGLEVPGRAAIVSVRFVTRGVACYPTLDRVRITPKVVSHPAR